MKILRVLSRPNVGGPMRQAVSLWHAHRAVGHHTVLVVGTCEPGEAAVDLTATGIPRIGLDSIERESGLLVVPELRRRVGGWSELSALKSLRRIVGAFRPDVVHTHTSKAGVLGRMAAKRAGAIVAHTFHGHVLRDYFAAPIGWAMRRLERTMARRSDLLFAVSESCATELKDLGVASEIVVVPPAVDTTACRGVTREAARRRLGLPADQPVLGCVGRLVDIKRVDRFVELVAQIPDAIGAVFGDGPLRASLQAASDGRVRWYGCDPDLPSKVAAFDLLIIPSEREGFPLCGIEAAAAGVPSVGFDVPGVRDLIAECGTGLTVPLDEGVDGLVRRVRSALESPPSMPGAAALVARCEPSRVAATLAEHYDAATLR